MAHYKVSYYYYYYYLSRKATINVVQQQQLTADYTVQQPPVKFCVKDFNAKYIFTVTC